MVNNSFVSIEIVGAGLFVCSVIHTFMVSAFQKWAHRFPEGSIAENFLHFLAEVEVVFGLWAAVFVGYYSFMNGFKEFDQQGHLTGGGLFFLESLNFSEPIFVFVIMCIAATRPIILSVERMILFISQMLPLSEKKSFFLATMILGPLMGSLITEPAAMTLTALILLDYFFADTSLTEKFKYVILATLFVNVSIGGTLTSFAAPPVLMVAHRWGWDIPFMLGHFGYKAVIAILISTATVAVIFGKQLSGELKITQKHTNELMPTWWMAVTHFLFLALVVYTSHHPVFLLSLFLFFVGFVTVTKEYQDEIKMKESLLVAFFLAGLIVLGSVQSWWLKPLLAGLNDTVLFFGATALTAVTDNAALTYLGSLVELSEAAKYSLVAGAVAGGGLTVIANAPNPAGYSLLKESFLDQTINPLYLFLAALGPTLIGILCFELLPSIKI